MVQCCNPFMLLQHVVAKYRATISDISKIHYQTHSSKTSLICVTKILLYVPLCCIRVTQLIYNTTTKVDIETIPEWAEWIACRYSYNIITLCFHFWSKYFLKFLWCFGLWLKHTSLILLGHLEFTYSVTVTQ